MAEEGQLRPQVHTRQPWCPCRPRRRRSPALRSDATRETGAAQHSRLRAKRGGGGGGTEVAPGRVKAGARQRHRARGTRCIQLAPSAKEEAPRRASNRPTWLECRGPRHFTGLGRQGGEGRQVAARGGRVELLVLPLGRCRGRPLRRRVMALQLLGQPLHVAPNRRRRERKTSKQALRVRGPATARLVEGLGRRWSRLVLGCLGRRRRCLRDELSVGRDA